MQGVVGEPPAESGIERARKRQAPRGPLAHRAGLRLDLSDGAPQTRHPLRSAAWRHSVRVLSFVICSCFWTKKKGESRRGELSESISVTETLPSQHWTRA